MVNCTAMLASAGWRLNVYVVLYEVYEALNLLPLAAERCFNGIIGTPFFVLLRGLWG